MTDNTVTTKEAVVIVQRAMEVERPIFLWGPPGIGKSDLIAQIGKKQNRPVIDMRLLLMEPTDIKGIPYFDPTTTEMRWAKPSELPGPNEVELHNAILFLDELNAAPPSVQAAAYQLILNRRVGEYCLPAGVSIVAAGNRETDKGVTFRMPSPLANRFVHIEIAVNFDDWQAWAVNEGVHPDVVGFLSHHKHQLFKFDPKSADKAFATPRSWVFVGELLDDTMSDHLNNTMVAGTVGEGLAIEFSQHRKIAAKLPKPEDILRGTVEKLKTKEISAMYSLTFGMCYTLRDWVKKAQDPNVKDYDMKEWNKNVDNFLGFMMEFFSTELVILGARTALREFELPIDHRELKNFKEFHEKYGDYILET